MKILKGLVAGIAGLLLALPLTACGDTGDSEQAASSPETPLLHSNPPGPINITLTPLEIEGAELEIGALSYVSGYVLTADHDTFGGLSGLAINDQDQILALEDIGLLVTADMMIEAGTEKLVWFANAYIHAVESESGGPLNPPPYDSEEAERCPSSTADVYEVRSTIGQHDTEGIDVGPNGDRYISFERHHRVLHYTSDGIVSVALPESVLHAPCNASLEAIALLKDGGILVVGEGIHNEDGSLKAWVSKDGTYRELKYPYVEGFRPTGLAALDDGDVLVVERFFVPGIGNKSRILRIESQSLSEPGQIIANEIAFFDGQNFPIDNLEGLATRETAAGETDIFLVSDHNFSPERQRTLLLQFRLQERP